MVYLRGKCRHILRWWAASAPTKLAKVGAWVTVTQNAAQFNSFMLNLIDYAGEKLSAWGHIPQARFDELVEAYGVFNTAFSHTQSPHTPAQNLARREAQAECTRILRAFVNQFLGFPPITNVERVEMGIPNHDTIRTDHIQFHSSLFTFHFPLPIPRSPIPNPRSQTGIE